MHTNLLAASDAASSCRDSACCALHSYQVCGKSAIFGCSCVFCCAVSRENTFVQLFDTAEQIYYVNNLYTAGNLFFCEVFCCFYMIIKMF